MKKLRMVSPDITGGSTTATNLSSASYAANIPTDFDLQDHGAEFRFAPNDINHSPKMLQYIGRKFFEGNLTVDDFVFQDAFPSQPTSTELSVQSLTEIDVPSALGLEDTKTYNYKLSPIFDGIQELPLPDTYSTITMSAADKGVAMKFRLNAAITGTAPNKVYPFNPRITAIKIYREYENDSNYFHIGTVPLNTKNDTANTAIAEQACKQGNQYVYSDNFISEKASLIDSTNGILRAPDENLAGAGNSDSSDWKYYWYYTFSAQYGAGVPVVSYSIELFTVDYDDRNTSNPAIDSTFLANMDKGYIVPTATGQTDDYFKYNESGGGIVRALLDTTLAGTAFYTKTVVNNVVWHDKAILFHNLANADRVGSKELSGAIARLDDETTHYVVDDSLGKTILLTSAITTPDDMSVVKHYAYQKILVNSVYTANDITFIDTGLTNGSLPSLYKDLKVQVNYKYSQMVGNRLFVGNVRLDPSGDAEDHPDWVVFSEAGQPDILPIINYIQIKDQQGGVIVGLNRILDSLVVLASRGIFRLDVGSTGDPANYILMEAEQNIGCVAPKGIINIKDNIFFCSHDAIYQIGPDFRFIPITEPIKDIYQGTASLANSRLFYDAKRNRMVCRFGDGKATHYAYDLLSGTWSKLVFYTNREYFGINDNMETISFLNTGMAFNDDLQVSTLHSSSAAESLTTEYKTGWIQLADVDRQTIVRRLNLSYTSGSSLTAKIYADGDDSHALFTGTFRPNSESSGVGLDANCDDSTVTIDTDDTGGLFKVGDVISPSTTSELMKVVSNTSGTLVVVRGYKGTTPSALTTSSTPEFHYANNPQASLRVSRRANRVLVSLTSATSTNDITINKIEIDHDG
jgi:hypothetical protein